jgi:hypothetical protein
MCGMHLLLMYSFLKKAQQKCSLGFFAYENRDFRPDLSYSPLQKLYSL